jgi:hypothetical protein
MDNFNVGKGGEPPKQNDENALTPADRARKGLFSRKEKAPKPAPAPKLPKAPKPAKAAKQAEAIPGAATAGKPSSSITAGSKATGSNTSKVILLAILGITILGAGGFFAVNTFILNKPVPPPQMPMNVKNRVPGAGGVMTRQGAQVAGQPAQPGQAGVPKVGELPALSEKGKAAQPAGITAKQNQKLNVTPAPEQPKKAPAQANESALIAKAPAKVKKAERPSPPPVVTKKMPEQKAAQPAKRAAAEKTARTTKVKPAVAMANVAAVKPAPAAPKHVAAPKPKPKPMVAVKPISTTVSAPAQKHYAKPAVTVNRTAPAAATIQISSLPVVRNRGKSKLGNPPPLPAASDDFYNWPGGSSKGHNKDLFDSQPSQLKQEHEKAMDEFASVKKLYMVLVKESNDPEELRSIGRKMPGITPPPEIKQTESHGRQIYWLTVGHYTTADKAYNKAQELKAMGVETTVVSEKIYY